MSFAAETLKPVSSGRTAAILAVVLLAGLVFTLGFALPYLRLSPEVLARYGQREGWVVTHVATGSIALLMGPFVLGLGLGARRMALHRKLGMVYMVSIALSSLAAFYLAFHTELGWVFGMGLAGLGVAWLTTTGLAFLAIKRRLIAQHKEWMIRSYVVTNGFVTFRLLVGVLQAAGLGTELERLAAASWFCWAAPLLVTEAILQGRKILAVRIGGHDHR